MGGQFAVADIWGVVITVVIMMVGWIMNTVQGVNKKKEQAARDERRRQRQAAAPGAPRGQGKPQRPRAVKSEIESFLEEVTGQKQRPPVPRPSPPARRPPSLPKSKPVAEKPQPVTQPENLGGGIAQHVSTYMSDSISEHVEHDIADHVDSHIGDETITDDYVRILDEKTTATDVRKMLSDPAGVRKAVLINEILQRRTFNR